MTPGSGVTLTTLSRESKPGGVPSRMTGMPSASAVRSMVGDEVEEILGFVHRRQENVQAAVARLDAQRAAGDPGGGFLLGGLAFSHGLSSCGFLALAVEQGGHLVADHGVAWAIVRPDSGGSRGSSRVGSCGMCHGYSDSLTHGSESSGRR